jgi:hypothetical protein
MIWVFSLLLCVALGLCVLFVVFPDMLAPFLIDHWKKHFEYWRN